MQQQLKTILLFLTMAAAIISISQLAFGHMSQSIKIPEDFKGKEPIPGIEDVAQFLLGDGRTLISSDQIDELQKFSHMFGEEVEELEREGISIDDEKRLQRYRSHLVLELLQNLSNVIKVRVQEKAIVLDPDDAVRLPGDWGAVLLRIDDGKGPVRVQIREANIDCINSEEVPPEIVPYASGGLTWLLLHVTNAPVGLTQIPLAFLKTDADVIDSSRTDIFLSGLDTDFGWTRDDRLKVVLLNVEAPPNGFLKVSVLGDNGQPAPAMVRLASETDGYLKRPANALSFDEQFGAMRPGSLGQPEFLGVPNPAGGPYWCVPGTFNMVMPAGKWIIHVYRGFEHELRVDTIEIKEGKTSVRTYQPKRWIDMRERGWYSGDNHVHARITSDSDAHRIMTWLRAADIHVGNILEMGDQFRTHYDQRGHGPKFRVQDGDYVLVPGQEDPRYWRGHAIGLNLKELVRNEENYILNDLVADRIHKQGGLYGFAHLGWWGFKVQRDMTLLIPRGKADFGEILQFSDLNTDLYFEFLDLGYRLTASAGSDTPYGRGIGDLAVYAYIGEQPFTPDAWFDAMKHGRTFVTNGPMIDLRVNEKAYPGDTVAVEPGAKVRIDVRAWGMPGTSAPELVQIIRHSEVIHEVRPTNKNMESITASFKLDTAYGAWVAARVFSHNGGQAHTTPIYLECDGFRFWNVDRAEDLIKKRLETLREMECELGELEEAAEHGNKEVKLMWANVLKNADALRARIKNVRGIIKNLRPLLEKERAHCNKGP